MLVSNTETCENFKAYQTIVCSLDTDDDGNQRNWFTEFWYGKYSMSTKNFFSTGNIMYLAIGK